MSMIRRTHKSQSRVFVSARPKDAASVIARNLLVRALRQHNLHHILHGKPAVVSFLVDQVEDTKILIRESLSFLSEIMNGRLDFDAVWWRKEDAGKASTINDAWRLISDNTIVFGFAEDFDDIPVAFRELSDGVVKLSGPDSRALIAAFRAVFGKAPSEDILSSASRLSINVLSICLRNGVPFNQAVGRLHRYLSAGKASPPTVETDHPRLEALAGLGEVRDWGNSLARDVKDYREKRIPWSAVDRGILVSGPSGTGKTMFARALGNTCGVPVQVHSLARWQARGHLGDLLKAMRSAFGAALQSAPSILFIDEIDAFGSRNDFSGQNEQYCREVVNGLLECLDGAESREGVVVVAATNFPEKVDPALLRPGRLDRHLRIPLPDVDALGGILRFHLGDDLPMVNLESIASHLEGSTGAVVEQVVRDARRRARIDQRQLSIADVEHALPLRIRLSDAAFRRACIHEAGHALVGHLLTAETGSSLEVVRVMRDMSYQNDWGQTTFRRTPGFDRSRTSYLAEITTLLAGLAAEEIVLGAHGDGGGGEEGSDIHLATILAGRMHAALGLGGSLVYLTSNDSTKLLEHVRQDSHIRRQIHATLKACAHRARTIVSHHQRELGILETALAHRGHLAPDDISRLIRETDQGCTGSASDRTIGDDSADPT
uniref:AAA ATPase, central domain protein n=1 Tax=Rhodopseudomonas palustris (strain BisA53) TaxID=316055 RepID=Q07NV6_RHOP5